MRVCDQIDIDWERECQVAHPLFEHVWRNEMKPIYEIYCLLSRHIPHRSNICSRRGLVVFFGTTDAERTVCTQRRTRSRSEPEEVIRLS